MKKYFVIAVMALIAVFAVSCNKEKKIDIVGHEWLYTGSVDTMGLHIDLGIDMAFNDADSVDMTTSITSSVYNQSVVSRWAYTWDGEKNLVLSKTDEDNTVRTRAMTYNKETEEFSLPLDQMEGDNTDQMIALTGLDVLVFKKVK